MPEGDKINNTLQKKKLNKLITLRSRQDNELINDIDTDMSTENNINRNINKINFAVNPCSQKFTPNVDSLGISTSYSKIEKSNLYK